MIKYVWNILFFEIVVANLIFEFFYDCGYLVFDGMEYHIKDNYSIINQ